MAKCHGDENQSEPEKQEPDRPIKRPEEERPKDKDRSIKPKEWKDKLPRRVSDEETRQY